MPSFLYLILVYCTIIAECKRDFTTGFLTLDRQVQARQTDSSPDPSTSSTSPTPTDTIATACSNSCSVCAVNPYTYSWTPYSITGSVVAATVIDIVNTLEDTTRTTTIFDVLPSGYSLPPTNADGTHVQSITYTRLGASVTTVL